jgi:tRNA dimethylallyltransferase
LAASGDPDTAARLAENDWYRMERAVEIVMSTGRPVGAFKPAPPPPYDFRCVMLTMPRVPLYR